MIDCHWRKRISFVWEKCLHQKNPLCTEKGDGCADINTVCLLTSIKGNLLCAKAPRSKKTKPFFFSDRIRITASVKYCQPTSLCDAGEFACTVSIALSKNTHCCARFVRLPDCGIGNQRSLCISLKMFTRDGGGLMPSGTEKLNPCACPAPWYGSWPNITTFTESNGVVLNALNINDHGGYIVWFFSFAAKRCCFIWEK